MVEAVTVVAEVREALVAEGKEVVMDWAEVEVVGREGATEVGWALGWAVEMGALEVEVRVVAGVGCNAGDNRDVQARNVAVFVVARSAD
jgi:hypothetical protein